MIKVDIEKINKITTAIPGKFQIIHLFAGGGNGGAVHGQSAQEQGMPPGLTGSEQGITFP